MNVIRKVFKQKDASTFENIRTLEYSSLLFQIPTLPVFVIQLVLFFLEFLLGAASATFLYCLPKSISVSEVLNFQNRMQSNMGSISYLLLRSLVCITLNISFFVYLSIIPSCAGDTKLILVTFLTDFLLLHKPHLHSPDLIPVEHISGVLQSSLIFCSQSLQRLENSTYTRRYSDRG